MILPKVNNFKMTEESNDKGMQQAKGGVLAQSYIELLRKSLEFYIKNAVGLSSVEESRASLLFHRLGRMEIK